MPVMPVWDKGPAEIVWGYGESGAVYLGKTLGGVKLTMETSVSDINEDQAGDAAVDAVLTGSVMSLEITLTRLSAEQLATALHTEVGVDGTIPIENQIGCSLYELSKQVVIKPICGNEVSTDPSTWVLLYKCFPVVGLDFTWDKDTQRIVPMKFKVFVSQESGYVGKFGQTGLESGATEFGL